MDVAESAVTENIREAASESGHVMKPIRPTDDGSDGADSGAGGMPTTTVDAESVLSVRAAVVAAKEERVVSGLPAPTVEAESVLSVRDAVVTAKEENDTESGAPARIADGEQPVQALTVRYPDVSGVPAVQSEASRRLAVTPDDGHSAEASSDDPDAGGAGDD